MRKQQNLWERILAGLVFGLTLSFTANVQAADEYSIDTEIVDGRDGRSEYSTVSNGDALSQDTLNYIRSIESGATGVPGQFNSSTTIQIGSFNSALQIAAGSGHDISQIQLGNENTALSTVVGGVNNTVSTLQLGNKNTSVLGLYGSVNSRVTHVQADNGRSKNILVLGANSKNILVIQR